MHKVHFSSDQTCTNVVNVRIKWNDLRKDIWKCLELQSYTLKVLRNLRNWYVETDMFRNSVIGIIESNFNRCLWIGYAYSGSLYRVFQSRIFFFPMKHCDRWKDLPQSDLLESMEERVQNNQSEYCFSISGNQEIIC